VSESQLEFSFERIDAVIMKIIIMMIILEHSKYIHYMYAVCIVYRNELALLLKLPVGFANN